MKVDQDLKQPLITNTAFKQLPESLRDVLADEMAILIGTHPTLSTLSTVDYTNSLLNKVVPEILKYGHMFNFNVSRQKIGQSIESKGQALKNANLKILNENIYTSSLIFDHWTNHGKNFIALVGQTCFDDLKVKPYVVGFRISNEDKSADGYIKDFESVLSKNYDFPMPMCTDNCPTMVKALRISSNSTKIYCLCHKLAKIDDKIHSEAKFFKDLDYEITKVNSYFNSRHLTSKLDLVPQKKPSTTRPWRSHRKNYETTSRNLERYFEKAVFNVGILNRNNIEKAKKFQDSFCNNFEILEKKDSTLLTSFKAYANLKNLANSPETKEIIGQILINSISDPKFLKQLFSNHAVAFFYLSRASAKKWEENYPELNIGNRIDSAIKFIKEIGSKIKLTKKTNIQTNIETNIDDLLFDESPAKITKFSSVELELEKFKNITSDLNCDKFWEEFGNQMPILSTIYKQLKSIPPSNSYVERLFSTGKLIASDLKNRTSYNSIEAQCVLCFDSKNN